MPSCLCARLNPLRLPREVVYQLRDQIGPVTLVLPSLRRFGKALLDGIALLAALREPALQIASCLVVGRCEPTLQALDLLGEFVDQVKLYLQL